MAQLASMMDLSFLGTYAIYGNMVPALDCAGSRSYVRKDLSQKHKHEEASNVATFSPTILGPAPAASARKKQSYFPLLRGGIGTIRLIG